LGIAFVLIEGILPGQAGAECRENGIDRGRRWGEMRWGCAFHIRLKICDSFHRVTEFVSTVEKPSTTFVRIEARGGGKGRLGKAAAAIKS
jgi:hypothetical protein